MDRSHATLDWWYGAESVIGLIRTIGEAENTGGSDLQNLPRPAQTPVPCPLRIGASYRPSAKDDSLPVLAEILEQWAARLSPAST